MAIEVGLCQCGCGLPAPLARQTDTKRGIVRGQPLRFRALHHLPLRRTPPSAAPVNPSGLCLCGCGQPTPIATFSNRRSGQVSGEARRFIRGHNARGCKQLLGRPSGRKLVREIAPCGCGCGEMVTRPRIYAHGHNSRVAPTRSVKQRADGNGYVIRTIAGRQVSEHVRIVEAVLGKRLPKGAEVHHVNGNRSDNRPGNLVVCQDLAYHKLLHVRQRSMDATGNPNSKKCRFCQQWDLPENFAPYDRRAHADCINAASRRNRKSA